MNAIRAVLILAVIGLALGVGIWIGQRSPGEQSQQAEAIPPRAAPKADIPVLQRDPYQRSLKIYEFRKAADSGTDRGREIFCGIL